jgi:predicted RNA-binding protein associated with RNAse of E/G family
MCSAIQEIVMPIYLPVITRDLWEKTAAGFLSNWQMPNGVGALEGKHINIFAPENMRSLYYNYKKHYSLVLMASVDASYKYLMIDVGSYGSNSDGGIFANCPFGQA